MSIVAKISRESKLSYMATVIITIESSLEKKTVSLLTTQVTEYSLPTPPNYYIWIFQLTAEVEVAPISINNPHYLSPIPFCYINILQTLHLF